MMEGLKESSGLNGIFHGKVGANQYPFGIVDRFGIHIHLANQVDDLIEMFLEDLGNIPVTHGIIPQRLFQCNRSILIRHLQYRPNDACCPFIACKQKTSDDPAWIGVEYGFFPVYNNLHFSQLYPLKIVPNDQ
jgi:hypothetical protein